MIVAIAKLCRYCRNQAKLLRFGDVAYPYRRCYGPIWACIPCQAWVGCHKGTTQPLGRLADAELRAIRRAAHEVFDPLWIHVTMTSDVSRSAARKAGYRWLSAKLKREFNYTHIAFMGVEECRRVIEVCLGATSNDISALMRSDDRSGSVRG